MPRIFAHLLIQYPESSIKYPASINISLHSDIIPVDNFAGKRSYPQYGLIARLNISPYSEIKTVILLKTGKPDGRKTRKPECGQPDDQTSGFPAIRISGLLTS